MPEQDAPRARGPSVGLIALLAIAGGASMGNLYLAQPALGQIGAAFGVASSDASSLVTMTQIGYALGVLFLVPLGDSVNRRRLIPALMLASAACLLLIALAPSFAVLLVGFALMGVATVAGQLMGPLAGDLAAPRDAGRVMATIAAGLIVGVIAGRVLGGVLTTLVGWQGVHLASAALMALLALLLARFLPRLPPSASRPSYARLLQGVVSTFLERGTGIRPLCATAAILMGVFTAFWTSITLLLESPPFSFPASAIGLVSLIGLPGALAAQYAGRSYDRGRTTSTTLGGYAIAIAGLALALPATGSLPLLIVGGTVFAVGVQAVNVFTLTTVVQSVPGMRSRLNTIVMTLVFVGSASGNAMVGILWPLGGWTAVMGAEIVLVCVAFSVWLLSRRRARA